MDFRSKNFFFLQLLVDILPLGSGSVDPHIFADPDPNPGSQNLADPMDPDLDPDPDPTHCSKIYIPELYNMKCPSLNLMQELNA